MSDGLFSEVALADPSALPGYRLRRLEVLNWGTFDRRVWTFEIDGRNALLTGDIGSGKSTLVDAITTLLMPSHRISYNKAAGADNRERDLRSYVRGHYKTARDEVHGTSRPVALRDGDTFSVILGVFANQDSRHDVTLAQVFWAREQHAAQPERFSSPPPTSCRSQRTSPTSAPRSTSSSVACAAAARQCPTASPSTDAPSGVCWASPPIRR